MKKIVFALVIGLALVSPRFAQAADLAITSFASDISVQTNAAIDVKEIIDVTFTGEHHGIYRDLPQTATFNGTDVRLPISDISVQRDGKDEQFTTSEKIPFKLR